MPAPPTHARGIPANVDWSCLSPRGLEIVRQVVMRLAAGYSYEEIAVVLEVHRADIQHLELPKGGVTKGWLSGQNELEQSRRLLGPGVVLESEVARAIRAGTSPQLEAWGRSVSTAFLAPKTLLGS